MKQNRLIRIFAALWLWLAFGVVESGAAGVPYSQLTSQQKQAFALRVQKYGLTVDQADRLLDADYLLKVELPSYRQCSFCKGTGASSYQTSQAKNTIRCTYCQGGGRLQRKIDSSYTYKEPSAQTFGSVQSDIKYEFIDCPKCGGSGRIVVYACADCGGAGMVAAGPGKYVIGKSPKAVSTTNAFDVLHLRNGKEIRQVQATKIAGDEADLRHSAGMGKYRRDDFTKEDAARLFGAEPEPAGSDLPKEALIDMTAGSSPSYLGNCALEMKDVRLLTLLMSMGVALDYENSPLLVLAIDKGETNLVAALLSRDASVDARDARGRSALRAAVEKGDRNLVSSLLAHDADPNTRDAKSATPLHVAAARGDVELVDYLIDHGARMDLVDEAGRTPFDYAKRSPLGKKVAEKFEIQSTDYARAKTLMAEGKFDDALTIYGKYKDRMAVQSAKAKKGAYYESRGQLQDALQAYKEANDADGVQRVTELLKGQQDKLIEAQNLEKAARLDDARAAYVQAGAPDDAKRLALLLAKEMEADGDLTRAIGYYESAGDWDSAGKLRKLSAMVAKAQGSVSSQSSNDMAKQAGVPSATSAKAGGPHISLMPDQPKFVSPLLDAAYAGDYPAVRRLVEQGADVNTSQNGFSALILAAAGGHLDIVEYLVAKGMDVNAENREGINALTMASEYIEVIMYLERMGADLRRNMAAMMSMSAANGSLNVVEYLVEKGADVNKGISDNLSPVACAAAQGHLDTVKYLVEKGADVDADAWAIIYAYNNGQNEVVDYLKSQMRGGEDILRALEARAKRVASNQPAQEDVDPAWYGYGYGLADVASSLNSLYNDGRSKPPTSSDMNSLLQRFGGRPSAGREYSSCFAGYRDCLQHKPARYPVVDDPPSKTSTLNASSQDAVPSERGVGDGWL